MTPFFSILIPVYNQQGKMDACIASLKRQTCADFEVILVNDGSTDGSQEMLEAFCAADSRFHVYTHEHNSSLVAARYTGMQHAAGQYVLFLDSDDWLDDDTCECLRMRLEKEPVDLLRFGYMEEPAGNPHPPEEDGGDPVDAQMSGRIAPPLVKDCCSASLIRRVVERVKPFYCNMSEDVFWSSVVFTSAESFGVIERMFYHYVQGSGMSTQQHYTPAALARNVKSIVDMSHELYAYVEAWAPQWMEKAQHRIRVALRYILAISVLPETDLAVIAEMLYGLKQPGTQALYEDACRELLPLAARKIMHVSDERMTRMGLEPPAVTWFS